MDRVGVKQKRYMLPSYVPAAMTDHLDRMPTMTERAWNA